MPAPRSLVEREKARQLFLAGESFEAISRAISVPASTIRNWKKRDSSWQRAQPEAELAIVPSDITTNLPETLEEAAAEYEQNLQHAAVVVSRRIAQMEPDAIVARADKVKQFDSTARKALRIESQKPQPVINIAVLAGGPARKESERLYSTVRPAKQLAD